MSALLSTLARVATMVISRVCGILTARLILGDAGIQYYALVSLLIALPSLVSFSDLGAGAVVINSAATPADSGVASGLYNTTVQVGGAIGLAVLSTVATSRSAASTTWASPISRPGGSGTSPVASAWFLTRAIVCIE